MSKRKTTEDFINSSIAKHGYGRFLYDKTKYINVKTPVTIFCIECNKYFTTLPKTHIGPRSTESGGCPTCAINSTKSKQRKPDNEYFKKASIVHKNKYKYIKIKRIKKGRKYIPMISYECPIHGEKIQRLDHHLGGCGCEECGKIRTKEKLSHKYDSYIQQAKKIHGSDYEYVCVYEDNETKYIKYNCKVHGEIGQRLADHIYRGSKCPLCAPNSPKNLNNEQIIDEYKNGISAVNIAQNHNVSYGTIYRILEKNNIPRDNTYSYFESQSELNIVKFCKTICSDVITRTKSIINPYELDIYIPSHKFAIEFNGVYWHSEQYRDKDYHYKKYLACKEKGIFLFQIWEDDYNRNPELIHKMIAHKLGVSKEQRVYARKCEVRELSKNDVFDFYEQNHLQGFTTATHHIGLFYNDELVAVCSFKNTQYGIDLVRFSTTYHVIGGFTKLLKHFIKTYQPSNLYTFSDNCYSDGRLYESNGFVVDKHLPPDYKYVVNNQREHKFKYRLKRFKNDPNLIYKEGLTERQLAELNGLVRIWDAGKVRWKLTSL